MIQYPIHCVKLMHVLQFHVAYMSECVYFMFNTWGGVIDLYINTNIIIHEFNTKYIYTVKHVCNLKHNNPNSFTFK